MGNPYRLPVTKVYGDCEVYVDFVDGWREEESRWGDIFVKLLEIVLECVYSEAVGGFGLVGQHDRIRVSIQYHYQVARGNDSVSIPYNSGNRTDA